MSPARRGVTLVLVAAGLIALATGWIAFDARGGSSGSTYVEAVHGQPSRLTPLAAVGNDAEGDLRALLFSGLTRIAADGSPELDLAESWEVTPDGLTYTFHLRSHIYWHDGTPFTAHDVAFTIARIQAEDFAGPEPLHTAWAEVEVFVADAHTILLRVPEPAADFLVRASLGIVPQHLADRMEADEGFEVTPFDHQPVGSGPYRLDSRDDERATLERHVEYHHGRPHIERIEFRFTPGTPEQVEALIEGDADAALLAAPQYRAMVLDERGDLAATALPRSAYTVLYFNTNRAPLTDPVLRRALAGSIDREAALALLDDTHLEPGDGIIMPQSWAYQPVPQPGGDSADVLWEASGWPRGDGGTREQGGEPLRLELITNADPEREALAAAIADQLGGHGVAVDVTPAPAARVIEEHLRPGNYDLALFGWEAGIDPDPYGGWHTSQVGAGNVAAFSDAEADVLMEAARTTLDEGERIELYARLEARLVEQAPALVIGYPHRDYVHPAGMQGVDEGLLFSPASRLRDVHLWHLP